jgi:nucleoside-diphosphate-sugar epimerase
MKESGVSADIAIRDLSDEPERPVASQADISRLMDEFGWKPEISLPETIRGIINHESHR